MISNRSLEVLRAIVDDYVAFCEPVGSKALVERHSFGVSAATIRNDMAMLEEEEFIVAPHTSSGRVPTDKGYRLFVDQLTELRPLSNVQREAIDTFLNGSADLDDLFARTVRIMAQVTGQLAVMQYPSFRTSRVRHIELVPVEAGHVLCIVIADSGQVEQRLASLDAASVEELRTSGKNALGDEQLANLSRHLNELVARKTMPEAVVALRNSLKSSKGTVIDDMARVTETVFEAVLSALDLQHQALRSDRLVAAGAGNLVRTEQDFAGNVLNVIDTIEEQVVLLRLFSELATDENDVAVTIGRENEQYGLPEASIVSSSFELPGRDISRLGVVGPTRMDYSGSMAAVRAVARYLSVTLNSA